MTGQSNRLKGISKQDKSFLILPINFVSDLLLNFYVFQYSN